MTSVGQITSAGPPPAMPPVPPSAFGGAPGATPPAPTQPQKPGRLADTPSRLSALSTVTVVVLILFGVVGGLAARGRGTALEAARADADQLVRLQAIRTNLGQADAAATNAYLAGGLEDPAQRERYVAGVAAVAAGVADAAQHTAGDADLEQLQKVNETLVRYTGLIESARANNRQHFPVGASYLRQASAVARTEMLPILSGMSVDTANALLADYDQSDETTIVLVIAVVIALVVLIGGEIWLAGKVRRYVNVPLGGATAIVMLIGLLALVGMSWSRSMAEDVAAHSYAATLALAQARVAAYEAKSTESLTLVFQGSGAGDTAWKALDAEVVRRLDEASLAVGGRALDDALAEWRTAHQEIRAADDDNRWKDAVALATSDEVGSSNQTFTAFAEASQAKLDTQVGLVREDLTNASRPMTPLALLIVLAGAVAAFVAQRGYGQRLAEYR